MHTEIQMTAEFCQSLAVARIKLTLALIFFILSFHTFASDFKAHGIQNLIWV